MDITYRPLEISDLDQLVKITNTVWNLGKAVEKTTYQLSKVVLYNLISNASFTRVCVVDNKIVGIITGNDLKSNHKSELELKCQELYQEEKEKFASQKLPLKKAVKKFMDQYLDTCYELVNSTKKDYQSELSLFLLLEEYRGKGIGQELYNSYINDLKENNLSSYYVITDDGCNYGFYEHQKMKRVKEKKYGIPLIYRFTIFIYDNNLQN